MSYFGYMSKSSDITAKHESLVILRNQIFRLTEIVMSGFGPIDDSRTKKDVLFWVIGQLPAMTTAA